MDLFVNEFLYSDKYDYLVKESGFLEFETIVPLKFVALSPIDGPLDDLFDLRNEMILEVPKEQVMAEDLNEYLNLSPIPEFQRPQSDIQEIMNIFPAVESRSDESDLREYKTLSPIPKFRRPT